MKLEDLVAASELCKKLKELGVKQESYFCWYRPSYIDGMVRQDAWHISESSRPEIGERCSAFTVSELGEIMRGHRMPEWRGGKHWGCTDFEFSDCASFLEVNARARKLIRLIEKGIVKP